MPRFPITRAEFLRATSSLAAGTLLARECRAAERTCSQCSQSTESNRSSSVCPAALRVRPYQLVCLVCAMGQNTEPKDSKLKELFTRIHGDPDVPLAICCNAGDVYL